MRREDRARAACLPAAAACLSRLSIGLDTRKQAHLQVSGGRALDVGVLGVADYGRFEDVGAMHAELDKEV
jgi:hypothetical protein